MHLIQLQGIYNVHADFAAFGRRSHSSLLLERHYDYKISYGNEAYSVLPPHIQLYKLRELLTDLPSNLALNELVSLKIQWAKPKRPSSPSSTPSQTLN